MAIRLVGGLLFAAVFLVPALAISSEDARAPEQLGAEGAHESADHAALAEYFRARAAAARAEMRLHKSMARSFHSGKKRRQLGARHCEKLVEQYRAIADEYDALAKLHDEEARTVP